MKFTQNTTQVNVTTVVFCTFLVIFMNLKNTLPDNDTVSLNLLELIAISGEFPTHLIDRVAGGRSYKETVVTALKRQGFVITYYKDSLRGLRLTSPTKRKLLELNPRRFEFALTGNSDTNHIKSDLPRRLRLHRIAEATITIQNADIAIFRDKKPDVFSPYFDEYTDLEIIKPVFYNSREIKEIGTDFVKIKGARSVGILITIKDIFVVYNMGGNLLKWDYKSEMRTKALMKTVLCTERLTEYSGEDIKGLLLADSMDFCYEILNCEGSKQHFLLDGNYENFYFLTNDYKGERLLSTLCNPLLDARLKNILMSDLIPMDKGLTIEHDAFEQDGTPVLFGFYCDLPRIKRFNTALSLQEKSGVIICFDFQSQALEKFCCEYIIFKTISFDKWERSFFER